MQQVLKVKEVFLDAKKEGILQLANAGMGLKLKDDESVITFKKEDLREIEFHRSIQDFNMRVRTTKDEFFNICNISENDIESIRTFISDHYDCPNFIRELEYTNISNGRLHLTNEFLEFKSLQKLIFDVHLKEIKNIHYAKNELTLSFPDAKHSVVEIKFHNDNPSLVDELKEAVSKQGALQEEIVTFSSISSVVPRTRNDYIFYPDLIRMVGSTYEHKIRYRSIKTIYLLDKDSKDDYCVLEINPPIRQGQTSYNYIVIIFNREDTEDFEIKLTPELKSKFPMLQASYSGMLVDSFLGVLKAVVHEKTQIIRSGDFQTLVTKRSWVKCSLKAYDGHLYPLPNCLFFLPKAICMPLEDIASVEFSRINISRYAARTFDMKISAVNGSFAFNTINKDEFGTLEQYFTEKRKKILSEVYDDDNDDEEEDDEESTSEYENELTESE